MTRREGACAKRGDWPFQEWNMESVGGVHLQDIFRRFIRVTDDPETGDTDDTGDTGDLRGAATELSSTPHSQD